jgi:hypothetical protein
MLPHESRAQGCRSPGVVIILPDRNITTRSKRQFGNFAPNKQRSDPNRLIESYN